MAKILVLFFTKGKINKKYAASSKNIQMPSLVSKRSRKKYKIFRFFHMIAFSLLVN